MHAAARLALAALLAATFASPGAAGTCPDRDPLRRPYFGDLHVHTLFSLDASTQQTRTLPRDAYRFARGEEIGIQPFDSAGQPLRRVRLARPLDFAAVTDHAELLGEWRICNTPLLPGYDSAVCRVYRRWPRAAFFYMNWTASRAERHGFCGEGGVHCLEAAREPWREIQEAARDADDPCSFTSFVGYEWTGARGAGNNLHRNVIFANDAVTELPISFVETPTPEALWARLRAECVDAGTGCDAVVIPHNSNLSAGLMFRTIRDDGTPIDAEGARARAGLEVLVEVMQHKGDSECHPGLGSSDELCGFEKLSMNNFSGRYVPWLARPPVARQFVRNVLKEGLVQEERLGVNPFHFGLIASTDTHLGTPGLVAETQDYPGHGGAGQPVGEALPPGLPDAIDFNPGGLAVLWAEENTRAALFAAMRRREAYGTSGPRITARFFGSWELPADACSSPRLAETGYARGVPMGGDLPPRPARTAGPVFLAAALRDPGGDTGVPGVPLQRIQVIKGWLEGGEPREQVWDVAGSADAGASVDLDTCETRGPGADALCAVWRDPAFDPTQRAFYYARVLENPTCRWSQKLCNAHGVRCSAPSTIGPGLEACCAESHVRVIQERAWTSPIWYRP